MTFFRKGLWCIWTCICFKISISVFLEGALVHELVYASKFQSVCSLGIICVGRLSKAMQRSIMDLEFEQISGSQEYSECVEYITERFKSTCESDLKKAEIFAHESCATDTNQVKFVIDSVINTCIGRSLNSTAMRWDINDLLYFPCYL